MKIMIVNSKGKRKLKTILVVIRNQVLDFILFFVTVYMRKYSMRKYPSAQGTTENIL